MTGFNPNAGSCTLQNLIGTGSDECDLTTLGDLVGAVITNKDVSFNIKTDDFLTKYKEFIRKGKAFPLIGLYGFEQSTPESEVATSSVGIQFEIREGKVQLALSYNKSHCFHKSVFTKKGFKKWNIILFFSNHVVGAKSLDGVTWKGFDCGMLSVGTFKVQQGTDPQMTKMSLQLTDLGTTEWNTRMSAVSNTELNAELNAIDGPIQTELKNVTVGSDAAAVGGSTMVVDIISACNGSVKSGLADSANWSIIGGQTVPKTVSTVAESATIPGRYTITLSSAIEAGDVLQLRLGSATAIAVEDILGNMYTGVASPMAL